MKKILFLFLSALLPLSVAAYTLGRVSVHDPSVVEHNGTFYIFGSFREVAKTTDMMNWTRLALGTDPAGAVGVPWKTSTSDNAPSADAFSTPAMAGTTVGGGKIIPNFDAKAWSAKGGKQGKTEYDITGNLWAPDVIYNTTLNKWCMYMSVNGDNWYSSIVLLTADNIEGPYTYQAPVVISGFTNANYKETDLELVLGTQELLPERYASPWVSTGKAGYPNNIDPCVFYDDGGNLWMSYGSWSGGIFMLKLDKTTGLRDYTVDYGEASNTSDPYFGKKIAGGYYSSGEASYIEKIGSYYYLFLSYGGLKAGGAPADYNNGGYQMRVFRSTSPDGPYLDPMGQNAVYDRYYLNFGTGSAYKAFGENIFGCYTEWGYQSTGISGERSQGHNSIIAASDGRTYLVYHTRFQNRGEGHEVRVHQVFQNEDGWLVAAPFEYTGETVMSSQIASTRQVATGSIPGTYKLLVHRNGLDHTQKETVTPVEITLEAGGAITGKYTGSWSVVDGTNSYINITLGSTVYKGVMINQTMEQTTETVPAFTALCSADGVSIWGYKFTEADVPTPVYFNDFSSTDGLTQVGSGEFVYENSRFGQIYHNNPAKNTTPRTNYLKLPTDVLTHSGTSKEMTIGFWINVKTAIGSNFFHSPVFSAYGSSTPGTGNGSPMFRCSAKGVLQINNGAGNWCDFNSAQNNNGSNIESTVYLDDQEWHYYTVTLTATTVAIYVDGTVVNSWTLDGTTDGQKISGFFDTAAANGYPVVCLGGNQSWDWADYDAEFGYDDIAIYNVALTPKQIAKIIEEKNAIYMDDVPHRVYFNDFSSTDGLTIVGGKGTFETSSDANYGQYYQNKPGDTPTYRENYLKLHSYVFSGINSSSEGMTIGMWVNGSQAHGTSFFWSPLFCAFNGVPVSGTNDWTMFYGGACTYLRYNLNAYDGGWCDFTVAQNENPNNDGADDIAKNRFSSVWLDDNSWHYYTVTLTNAESGKATVYVDGVKQNSWTADFRGLFNTVRNLNYVCLGGCQYGSNNDIDAAFAFDEFAVYDVALSQEEIAAIYGEKVIYGYTVKAIYDGKPKTIATGSKTKGQSITVAYPRYILDGTKLYEAAATSGKYAKTFTLSSENQEETITYNASTTSNVFYYAEAEDVLSGATSDLAAASNGKLGGRQKNKDTYTELVTLPAGTWQIATSFYVGNSGDHTVNFKVGDEVKWTCTKGASSGWYNGTSENIVLTQAATVSVAVDGGGATGLDWIYIKSANDFEVVGNKDLSTTEGGAKSSDYTLKMGETKVFTFRNHGQDFGKNWRILVKEGEALKSTTRADFFDATLNKHLAASGDANDWALMSTDGGTSKVGVHWDRFQEDMADALVQATVVYDTDGKLTINAVSTGSQNGYIYYVDNVNNISGLTGDLTVNLSVNESWLEVISVEQTTVGATTTAAGKGFATLYTDKALDFSGIEGLTAYTATLSDETVTLTAVSDIPANTGVVLKGEAGKAYSIPVISSSTTAPGDLQGSTAEATAYDAFNGYDIFMLAINSSGKAQFTKVTKGSIAAGKAYLKVSKANGVRMLSVSFDGEATGINTVEKADEAEGDSRYYNLSGQRVTKPAKGIYILNGKKVIIK